MLTVNTSGQLEVLQDGQSYAKQKNDKSMWLGVIYNKQKLFKVLEQVSYVRGIYKDFRNIIFNCFWHRLGVPQEGSTLRKVDFQVTPIALLLGV